MFNKQFFRFLNRIPSPVSLTAKAWLLAVLLTPFAALANTQPTITSNPQTTAAEDNPYEYIIVAQDDDGDTLTYSVDSIPTWLTFNSSTQTISGTPTNADIGPHNMKVSVSDGSFVVSQNFTVTVSNTNDIPTVLANIANQTITEDVDFKLDISSHFLDVDFGDTLTFTAENLPSGLTLGSNGNIIGAPNNADALASPFNVTITATDTAKAFVSTDFQIVVVNVNDAPEPVDDNVTLAEDGSTNIDILRNDVDVDNDLLPSTAFITNTPVNGQATVDTSTGIVTYTPNTDYNGTDTMTYRITDPDGLAGTATISLTITPVNDSPSAQNDVASTNEDTLVAIDVLANDTDPDAGDAPQGDQIVIEDTPTNGQVQISSGLVNYTPNTNYNGTDSFTYKVADNNGAIVV
ncbi:MAG: tandem-95 repeat protein, partial [Algicola sp.]|nr:tandem-95 repeat protein [Algicola sp.]